MCGTYVFGESWIGVGLEYEYDTWLQTQFLTPDDERVTLETCRVLPSNKEHKKLHLFGIYMIIIY